MYLVIDRFEDGYALVELPGGETVQIPEVIARLAEAKEGDVLLISVDEAETARRKEKASGLLNRLFKRSEPEKDE